MTAESAAESPNVVIGTSMVNSYPSGFLHQMEARPTDGIRVMAGIPDVFPEDLSEEGR